MIGHSGPALECQSFGKRMQRVCLSIVADDMRSPSPLYSGERGWGEGADLAQHSNPLTPAPLPRVQGRGENSLRGPSPPYSGEGGWGGGPDLAQHSNPLPPAPLPRVQGRGENSGHNQEGHLKQTREKTGLRKHRECLTLLLVLAPLLLCTHGCTSTNQRLDDR